MNTRQLDEMETSAWGRDSLTTNSFPSTFSTLAILNPLEELEVPIHLRNDILYNDRDIQQSSRLEDLMIDPELVNPCHFENSSFKPPISFYPPIWTQSRQELCESFDWFRSYQSGVYHANNVVKGYLLSAFSSRRDRFEHYGRLIISHGGGKAESLRSNNGHLTTQPADDQLARDKSVRALLTTYRQRRPLVLVIDDKYTLFPYDLGSKDITYAILGFYIIVAAWAEYQPAHNERGRVVRWKFAFQWCESQGHPWWVQQGASKLLKHSQMPTIPLKRTRPKDRVKPAKFLTKSMVEEGSIQNGVLNCNSCGSLSPLVYSEGKACLNPECHFFWLTEDGCPLPDDDLHYRKEFLTLNGDTQVHVTFEDLVPNIQLDDNWDTTGYSFSRGWHCKFCGRLSCRVKWEYWECQSCRNVRVLPGPSRRAQEFWEEVPSLSSRYYNIVEGSEILALPPHFFRSRNELSQLQSFVLPHGRGLIHHIRQTTQKSRQVADEIFDAYQQDACTSQLLFRRWPLRSHKLRGPMLTNYFSQNCGEPYQYVGGTANTLPFDKTPAAVIGALTLIKRRIKESLDQDIGFNEVLSAAYMERQRMAFHSDSERGLGPVVAGLSLGAPAIMHFRLHTKHEPNPEERHFAMTVILRHGDILVMQGSKVQEFYEHTLIPTNFRFAATARWIDPVKHVS